jgi:hypothetical protein
MSEDAFLQVFFHAIRINNLLFQIKIQKVAMTIFWRLWACQADIPQPGPGPAAPRVKRRLIGRGTVGDPATACFGAGGSVCIVSSSLQFLNV